MNFGTVGVQAYLDLLDSQFANAPGLRFADHRAIGFHFDVEQQAARVFHDVEEIAAHEDFTTTERQEENSGIGKLIEDVFDFGRGHLAVIVVIEVAVDAAFVAPISNVQMHAERNAEAERLLIHLRQKAHRATAAGGESMMGCADMVRMPCWQRSSTNCSASRLAWSGSTSNSGQIWPFTMLDNGVRPSAACQINVAISLRVKKVESTADMIIISPPMRRAAMAELRAMYLSAITALRRRLHGAWTPAPTLSSPRLARL